MYVPMLPYQLYDGMECNGNGMKARGIQSDIAIYVRIAIHVYAIVSAIGVNKDHGPMMVHAYICRYICMYD